MANREVRVAAMDAGVKMWQVAMELGIADSSLSRKLRRELSAEEKTQILEIIERLKEDRNEN